MSRWLYSRAIFPVAEFLKQITWDSLQDLDAHRQIIFEAIVKYRKMKNQGVVAVFQRDRFDRYSHFARIGDGSLGGKGRGLAFIDNMVKRHPEFEEFENAIIEIPKTVVLCTDIFDEFMETNQLYQIALSEADDDTILRAFLRAKLPDSLVEDFFAFFDVVKAPIAIRSSSLLEDSHYQPFAGIYSTYMIPYMDDKYERLRMLSDAIKGVYASVFYKDSKAYMQATSNVIDEEKMAVILQEVVGTQYGDRYYPTISGVARSVNYYPINDELAEEGTVSLALGLGKYIVDGGLTLRVCPYHPDKVLQTSEMEMALRETQTRFYALDLKNLGHNFSLDDGFNLLKLSVKDAEADGSLNYIASTYDPYDMVIRDGIYPGGNILQHDVFPLARILQLVQKYGQGEMRRPVEIEFAVNLDAKEKRGVFYLLQIRPMVDMKADLEEDLETIPEEHLLLKSENSLGQGIMNDIQDVIYVKTEGYSASNNQLIAYDIEKLRKALCLGGSGKMGKQRYVVRNSGEMAQHIGSPCDCRSRLDQLSGRPQPRHPFLPKPDIIRSGLFYNQYLLRRRHFQRRAVKFNACRRRDQIHPLGTFRPTAYGKNERKKETRRSGIASIGCRENRTSITSFRLNQKTHLASSADEPRCVA